MQKVEDKTLSYLESKREAQKDEESMYFKLNHTAIMEFLKDMLDKMNLLALEISAEMKDIHEYHFAVSFNKKALGRLIYDLEILSTEFAVLKELHDFPPLNESIKRRMSKWKREFTVFQNSVVSKKEKQTPRGYTNIGSSMANYAQIYGFNALIWKFIKVFKEIESDLHIRIQKLNDIKSYDIGSNDRVKMKSELLSEKYFRPTRDMQD